MEIEILKKYKIDYKIKYSKRKTIGIHFSSYNELVIACPNRTKDEEIIRVIDKHINWILEHRETKAKPFNEIADGVKYELLGKEYIIRICQNKHEKVERVDDTIYIYVNNISQASKKFKEYCYELCDFVYSELLDKAYHEIIEIRKKYPHLIVKESKRNWGYCRVNEGVIMINLSLIRADKELIEYVIYHELCHLVFPNHSKEFHGLLSKYIPDEKQRRKKLSRYPIIW